MSQGCPSVWQDLTKTHEQIRRQLEGAINCYVYGKCEGESYYAPIIVAPYGSGKTTLLRHLLCFSIRNEIPAVLVNLSSLVDYLKNKVRGKIDEGRLPDYVEEFCRDIINDIIKSDRKEEYSEYFEHVKKCCIDDQKLVNVLNKYTVLLQKNPEDAKCVLLIDEIEEAYNQFRELISYGTTPFRGLFDSIKEGRSKVLTIMAFGPSSIYSEAVSLSGTWRTNTFIIPLIKPLDIPVEGVENELRPYIANLVWWVGKGRAGHVWEKVIKSINIESIGTKLKGIVESVESGSSDPIETLMSNIDQVFGSLKGVKVTEGTPYIDFKVYRELLTEVYKRGNKDLLKLLVLLTLLIGPVPQSILERYLGKESIGSIIKLRIDKYIVKSNKVFEVNDVISKIMEWLNSNDPFIEDLLRNVMLAWSDHKILLLDIDALNDLFDIIKALSIEMYKPEIYDLLNRIDIKALHNELEKLDSNRKSDEYYFALRPSVIEQLYPPIILTPLIGCSKDKEITDIRNELSEKTKVEEVLRFSEELLHDAYGDQKLDFVFAVVPSTLVDAMKEPLLSKLMSNKINKLLLLPIPIKENEDLDKAVKDLEDRWKSHIDCGIAGVINPGEKPSLFIMGKLYNRVENCQRGLDRIELNLFSQYMNALRRLIDEKSRSIKSKLIDEELISGVRYEINYLSRQAGRAVGSNQARYVWLLSSSPNAEIIKDYLIGVINAIESVKEAYKDAFNVSDNDIKDTILADINLLVNEVNKLIKNNAGYIEKSLNLWREVSNKVMNTSHPIFEVLRDFASIKLKELENKRESVIDIVDDIYDSLERIMNFGGKPLGYMLIWYVLSNEELSKTFDQQLDSKLNELKEQSKELLNNILGQLHILKNDLEELRQSIYNIISVANDENLRKNAEESKLMENINDYEEKLRRLEEQINELNKYYSEMDERLSNLKAFEKMLTLEFIYDNVLGTFLKNIDKTISSRNKDVVKNVNVVDKKRKELVDAIGCVNAVKGDISSILQYELDDSIKSGAVRAVIEDFLDALCKSDDLSRFKDECNNLKEDIKELNKVLSKNIDVLKRLKNVYDRILRLRNILERGG